MNFVITYRISSYSFRPWIVSSPLCTVTFGFPNPKKETMYMGKYGTLFDISGMQRNMRTSVSYYEPAIIREIETKEETIDVRALTYTHAHLWFPPSFLAVKLHNDKNWVPSILRHNLWFSWGWSKKKFKNGLKTQKMHILTVLGLLSDSLTTI